MSRQIQPTTRRPGRGGNLLQNVSAGTEALWQDELHCEVQLAWGGRGSESVIAGCWLDAKTSPIRHLSAELIVLAGLV